MRKPQIESLLESSLDFIVEKIECHSIEDEDFCNTLEGIKSSFQSLYRYDYDSKLKCLAYASRYGLKTCFQTWSNLEMLKNSFPRNVKKVVVVGGGCGLEIPVLMSYIKSNEIRVRVYDVYSREWNIFKEYHENYAQVRNVNLDIDYLKVKFPGRKFYENIQKTSPDLIVFSNILNEIDERHINNIYKLNTDHAIFVQDMDWNKFDLLRAKFSCFEKCKNLIKDFPSARLNKKIQYSLDVENDFYTGVNGGKNYAMLKG